MPKRVCGLGGWGTDQINVWNNRRGDYSLWVNLTSHRIEYSFFHGLYVV